MLAASSKSDRVLLRLAQLVEPPRGAHADFDGIGLKVVVFRLLGVGPHGDGDIEDILRLVDRLGLGQRTAGVVIASEGEVYARHGGATPRGLDEAARPRNR